MERSINIFNGTDELSHFLAEHLAMRIHKIPDGQFFSMALSGGSTPKAIFQYLALHYKEKIEWQKVLIFWGDERCVPPDDEESNYLMARKYLLDQIPIPSENVFRIKGENEPKAEAVRYTEVVNQHVPSVNNIPRFDFVMLGLGDDGHTASIFPGNLHLFSSRQLFDVAEHPQTKQKRITATGTLINHSKTVAFLVTGSGKSEMVSTILDQKEGWENLPASLIHPDRGELLWLLDKSSSSKLTDFNHGKQ